MAVPDTLKEKLDTLPDKPGVYLFQDRQGKIIYIGKARVLRHRVRSYFQKGHNDSPKLQRLLSRIHDVEFIVTDSEVEALILEANLIKVHKPRYNVSLKDDKSYPYIRVTNEPFPRIFPTRKIIRDGSRYFGPYTDVHALRSLLRSVRRIFPIRSCDYNLTEKTIADGKYKLCLDYYIKRCRGPCEGLQSREDYDHLVQQVVDFINGKDEKVVRELTALMEERAAALRFEEAAQVRDQIEAIEAFRSKQKVVLSDPIDRDIVAVYAEDDDACGIVLKVRHGKVLGRQHFYLEGVEGEPESRIVASFLKQFYLNTDFVPDEIFLPCEVEDAEHLEAWLSQQRNGPVKLVVPKDGEATTATASVSGLQVEAAKLVQMAVKNAQLLLEELKLQKMKAKDYVPHSVKALQRDLRLTKLPRRIEAFDISNIQGADAVASMVCFEDGKPKKSDYRRFKIRSKATPDDFAMMNEVVRRRYARVLEEKAPLPDLILIDGGKGQLSAALDALSELGITDQPVIALAKRLDEVYVPGIPDPQNLPRSSSGLRLLQRIRDESHRFAVTYHRQVRTKRTIASALDEIPGIGDERRRALISWFGSLKRLQEASVDEIAEVEGISQTLAREIWEYFHHEQQRG